MTAKLMKFKTLGFMSLGHSRVQHPGRTPGPLNDAALTVNDKVRFQIESIMGVALL